MYYVLKAAIESKKDRFQRIKTKIIVIIIMKYLCSIFIFIIEYR
jgi:hypothetical protein